MEEAIGMLRQEEYGNSLHCLLRFAVNLKLLQKNEVFLKNVSPKPHHTIYDETFRFLLIVYMKVVS